MFAKLLAIVLTTALTAAALLGIRHERLDLAHEASRLHQRMNRHEMTLWRLQGEIARRSRPEAVQRSLLSAAEAWSPIPAGPAPPLRGAACTPMAAADPVGPRPGG